jgi:hypothetical protein
VFDEGVDDVGVLAVDVDGAAAEVAGGGEAAAELLAAEFGPVGAAVGGAIDAAAGSAAGESEDGAAALVGGGVEDVGALRVDGDVVDAGVGIDGEGLLPGGAAVEGAVDAALLIGSPEVALGGDVDDVGVGGVDDDASDVVALFESDVGPGGAAVHRLVDAVAPGGALAIVRLACAGVEDGGVGGGEGEVANGGVGLVVEDRGPGLAAVEGFEDAAGRGADVDDARVRLDDGEVVDAAAHGGGSDIAELEIFECGFEVGLGEETAP